MSVVTRTQHRLRARQPWEPCRFGQHSSAQKNVIVAAFAEATTQTPRCHGHCSFRYGDSSGIQSVRSDSLCVPPSVLRIAPQSWPSRRGTNGLNDDVTWHFLQDGCVCIRAQSWWRHCRVTALPSSPKQTNKQNPPLLFVHTKNTYLLYDERTILLLAKNGNNQRRSSPTQISSCETSTSRTRAAMAGIPGLPKDIFVARKHRSVLISSNTG